jgi:hypothetical protein
MLGEAWLALKIPDLEANTTIPFFATHSREKKKMSTYFFLFHLHFVVALLLIESQNRKPEMESHFEW